jgi:hypothetical protein
VVAVVDVERLAGDEAAGGVLRQEGGSDAQVVDADEAGGTALAGSPAEFGAFIAAETEKWGKVVTFAGLKPD